MGEETYYILLALVYKHTRPCRRAPYLYLDLQKFASHLHRIAYIYICTQTSCKRSRVNDQKVWKVENVYTRFDRNQSNKIIVFIAKVLYIYNMTWCNQRAHSSVHLSLTCAHKRAECALSASASMCVCHRSHFIETTCAVQMMMRAFATTSSSSVITNQLPTRLSVDLAPPTLQNDFLIT